MATIIDISVTTETWVDVSSVTGIAVGTGYNIQNKKGSVVILVESATEPQADYTSGKYVAPFPSSVSTATILEGSSSIWAKAKKDNVLTGCTLNCQEI